MPKSTTELIREIAVLELEVVHLEQYLLPLYRKAFDQNISSLSPPTRDDKLKSPKNTKIRRCLELSKSDTIMRKENTCAQPDRLSVSNPWKETTSTTEDKVRESEGHQSHSSLTQHSALSKRASTTEEIPGKALRACQSQPSSMMQVRVYTPKRVFQELEEAKEEYTGATFGMKKDQKLVLPKVVESFTKDSGLCPAGVMEMIQQSLPESLRRSIKKIRRGNSNKNIEWVPHNFAFRYLIMKELVK